MHSLRQRLIWSLAAVLSVVWVIGGTTAYLVTKGALERELERSLVQQLGQIAPLIAVELFTRERHGHQPTSEAALRSLWVEAWAPDGTPLLRSALLGTDDLPRPEPRATTSLVALDAQHVVFSDLTLPNGTVARAVAARIQVPAPHQRRFAPPAPTVQKLDLLLAQTRETVERPLEVLAWLFLAVSALSIGVLAWAGRWFVHRELRPLDQLRVQIAAMEPAGLAAPIELDDAPMELAPVRDQLNAMLARLDAAFRREKDFAAHAAHELNTPLAALQATTEVALATPPARGAKASRADASRADAIRADNAARGPADKATPAHDEHIDALRTCHRLTLQMNTTVRALLDLVRPGTGVVVDLDLQTLAQETHAQFAETESAEAERIRITPAASTLAPPMGDPEQMRRVLHNVLGNALDYGTGAVDVEFHSHGNQTSVTVTNQAEVIHPELPARAFETFWRADPARHDQHVGLGLSLCKNLIERMGGTMTLRVEGQRVVVTVQLPNGGDAA